MKSVELYESSQLYSNKMMMKMYVHTLKVCEP